MISLPVLSHLLLVVTCSCLCIQACHSLGFVSFIPGERGRWRRSNTSWTEEKRAERLPLKSKHHKESKTTSEGWEQHAE